MSKFTGKKKKLDYKPILYGTAVGLPVIVLLVLFVLRSHRPIEAEFTNGPAFDAHLTPAGMFLVRWETNLPARGNIFYRFAPDNPYQSLATDLNERGAVAVPAQPGQTIDFYIEAFPFRRSPVRSKSFQVKILPSASVTSTPADAKMSG